MELQGLGLELRGFEVRFVRDYDFGFLDFGGAFLRILRVRYIRCIYREDLLVLFSVFAFFLSLPPRRPTPSSFFFKYFKQKYNANFHCGRRDR